jgi:hypothetical protein
MREEQQVKQDEKLKWQKQERLVLPLSRMIVLQTRALQTKALQTKALEMIQMKPLS